MLLSPQKKLSAWIQLLRCKHWIKNLFVFIGFAYNQHWTASAQALQALLAFIAFCLISSSVYIFNDWQDQTQDRSHPIKKFRPIAAGFISSKEAFILFSLLFSCSLLISFCLSWTAVIILLVYLLMNILYSCYFKNIPYLDISCIAISFMLRILMGTIGIGIVPSQWLLLCTTFLTFFLGLSKRRAEMTLLHYSETSCFETRPVLRYYSITILDQCLTIFGMMSFASYAFYSLHHPGLPYTLPFTAFGIYHYWQQLKKPLTSDDPLWIIFNDKISLFNLLIWSGLTIYFLCFH